MLRVSNHLFHADASKTCCFLRSDWSKAIFSYIDDDSVDGMIRQKVAGK